MSKPKRPGWYWFLPNETCKTPTGLLRIDRPVVLLVSSNKHTRDGDPGPLVVVFSTGAMAIDELAGDFEAIEPPGYMLQKATDRLIDKARGYK